VKDVAAAGGWKDVTTLINCYQQPDDDTLRMVVEYRRPGVTGGHRKNGWPAANSDSHTPQIGAARHDLSRCRA